MPIRTPLTKKLEISHPILLAPMDVVADARLTAAVSAAGGLGILGGGYGDEQWLRESSTFSQRRRRALASASLLGVWRGSRSCSI